MWGGEGHIDGTLKKAEMEALEGGNSLRSYAGAPCQRVQSDAFPEEDLPDRTPDGGAVFDGFKGLAFTDMPVHPADTSASLSRCGVRGQSNAINGLRGYEFYGGERGRHTCSLTVGKPRQRKGLPLAYPAKSNVSDVRHSLR